MLIVASDQLSVRDRRVFSRAVEATIWGMPAVSMAAFRRSLPRDLDAAPGDVVFMSNVMEPRHAFLTANNQTPYVALVFDLRDGPMVLDVPAATDKVALFGSGIDSWEVPLVDVGPSGDDAGKGGRYLFLPPGYSGERPKDYFVVCNQLYPRRAPSDRERQRDPAGCRRVQPAPQDVPAGRRCEPEAKPLHRRLPTHLEDAAGVRPDLSPAARGNDRCGSAAGQGCRDAGDAREHRHRKGQAVQPTG